MLIGARSTKHIEQVRSATDVFSIEVDDAPIELVDLEKQPLPDDVIKALEQAYYSVAVKYSQ